MKLKYTQKKPRRIELLIYPDSTIDVPDEIGKQLVRVTGFQVVTEPAKKPARKPAKK